MLTLICLFLAVIGLNGETYTCPNGQTYDDTTVTFCTDVIQTSSCTFSSETTGICTTLTENNNLVICCPQTDNLSTVSPDTTAVSACDDDLRSCYDGCRDSSSSDDEDSSDEESSEDGEHHHHHSHDGDRDGRRLLHNHQKHHCFHQCESVWETCSGQSFSSELVEMDNNRDSSSKGSSEGTSEDSSVNSSEESSGSRDDSSDSSSSSAEERSEEREAYAFGSPLLSFFIIPLLIIIFISICCCCFCKKYKHNELKDVRTANSIVSMQRRSTGHVRVPSSEVHVTTTSINGETTFVNV